MNILVWTDQSKVLFGRSIHRVLSLLYMSMPQANPKKGRRAFSWFEFPALGLRNSHTLATGLTDGMKSQRISRRRTLFRPDSDGTFCSALFWDGNPRVTIHLQWLKIYALLHPLFLHVALQKNVQNVHLIRSVLLRELFRYRFWLFVVITQLVTSPHAIIFFRFAKPMSLCRLMAAEWRGQWASTHLILRFLRFVLLAISNSIEQDEQGLTTVEADRLLHRCRPAEGQVRKKKEPDRD